VATRAANGYTSYEDHDSIFRGMFDSVECSIEAHDGVMDMIFDKIYRPNDDGDFILRLNFGVKNDNGANFRNAHSPVSTI
jgi:hypothetical protein